MATRCYFLEPTDTVRRWLRRYTGHRKHGARGEWTCAAGWHEAMVLFDETRAIWEQRTYETGRSFRSITHKEDDRPAEWDPRWPTRCAKCDYDFDDLDERQLFYDLLYRRADTSALTTLRDALPGAMWDAWWLRGLIGGQVLGGPADDGRRLMVKCPNGREWFIDGRASNCTLPQDDNHRCWVRHGEPPDLVVDKQGVTCSAGAGSIQAGDYHGFLGAGGAPPGWFT
jgi:hypothetical protein